MKRVIAIILAALCLLSLAACGGGASAKAVDLAAVKDKIITDLSVEGAMDVEADRLLDLYGIAAEDIKSSACFVTMDGVFPDEIVMIEATDAAAASRVAEKLNKRLEEVMAQSANYDAENLALAKECKVNTQGSYVTMFLSAKHSEMESIFEAASK